MPNESIFESKYYKLPSGQAELHQDRTLKYPQRKDDIVKALREAMSELYRLKQKNIIN